MKLFFREVGEGPPIIILHGLMGASDNWLSIANQLSENHSVYSVDLRNHGRSPHSDEFTFEAMAQDIYELMEDEEIRQPALIGHSMGGKVAMALALLYPHKIQKLLIVDVAPKKYTTNYFETLIGALLKLNVSQLSSRKEADEILSVEIPDDVIRSFLLKNLERIDGNQFIWQANLQTIFASLPKITDNIFADGEFNKATLFVRGGKSNYIQDEDIPKIKSLFPKATITTINNAGHWVHAEAPKEFIQVVREFL